MNQPTTPLRYVAFPPVGAVSEVKMTREEFVDLRRTSPQWKFCLDVTPRPLAMLVYAALRLTPWWRQPVSSLRVFPCPECAGRASQWVVCELCGGSRRYATVAWEVRDGAPRRPPLGV